MMRNSRHCSDKYQEMISAYIDGELSSDERNQLLQHLATCDACREMLEGYRAIGSQIRSLPNVRPPSELRAAIYAETIDSGPRRLSVITSRLGYSLAGVAAVALIFTVAIYLIIGGYQRSIDPEVVSSAPNSNVVWPLHRPVEIKFNKSMDHASVESALSIAPASEKERLNRNWDGKTLILGQNQTLKPGSSYSISISNDAEDKYGKTLGQDFSLQFETSETVTQLETPVPPTPTFTPTSTVGPTATALPTATTDNGAEQQVPPPAPPTATPEPSQPAPTSTSVPAPPPATNVPVGPGTGGVEPTVPPTPTDIPLPTPTFTPTPPPPPQATATALPSATPVPTATLPPPTLTPMPTATVTQPSEPAMTATPETIPVSGAFGNVYWGNAVVMDRLGAPLVAETSISAQELDFQHGAMFLRADTDQVYVIESLGLWSQVQDTASDDPDAVAGPAEGTWEPAGALGSIWHSESWIRDAVGLALNPEAEVFESQVQEFASGTMILSQSGQIYVIYADGTWELYSVLDS